MIFIELDKGMHMTQACFAAVIKEVTLHWH